MKLLSSEKFSAIVQYVIIQILESAKVEGETELYVIVISRAEGMYGIHCTEARGHMPKG